MNIKTFSIILFSILFMACNEESDPQPAPSLESGNPSETPLVDTDGTYLLPIIFHVLYEDENDKNQYIPAKHLQEVLKKVNEYYKGKVLYQGGEPGVNIGVKFVLAESNEKRERMETPGVEYIPVSKIKVDCMQMMSDKSYLKYLWEQNRYINILLYHFAEVEGGTILGISHMPYSVEGDNELKGLEKTEYDYLHKSNLAYPHCISLNSLYAYETTTDTYNSADFAVTMAHELGHYLGLHHAFNEYDRQYCSADSDFCPDTPPYDRDAYLVNLEAMIYEAQQSGKPVSLSEAVKRENCKNGETFSAYNIMDYEISFADRLSNDQRVRIQHVLQYSPLLPTPRNNTGTVKTRAVEGVLDLPYRIVK